MLKRKWIIDNAGRLVGVWKDRSETHAALAYLNEQPALKAIRAPGLKRSVAQGWFRALRNGGADPDKTLRSKAERLCNGWAEETLRSH
jgi:hypothetical protein